MPELPTCECVRGMPPYDRLIAIYQAAAELSGDTSLPDSLCVAGVPPFSRFSYIYAAFRVLADDDTLPSQECVEGESKSDQVARIYQAAAIYADDDSLLSYECVRGLPIWQQWLEIYRAIYIAQGSPAELTDPDCANIAGLDVLSEVFCGLVAACETPEIVSATIGVNGTTITLVFSTNVTGTGAGFLVDVEGDAGFLTYTSGSGTHTLVFEMDIEAPEGATATINYAPGDITNGSCPLLAFEDFPVTNNAGVEFTYFRPDGVSTYFRPDGTSIYIRP